MLPKSLPSGTRFGRLIVLGVGSPRGSHFYSTSRCLCDCGNVKEIANSCLKSGDTVSCGCYHFERLRTDNLVHGHNRKRQRTRTYEAWLHARNRCLNPNDTRYASYGGAGVKFCERWNDFSVFLADLGECPPGLTLDRWPNPKGNYEPGNCRWATWLQQARNKGPFYEFQGVRACLSELCERFNLPYRLLQGRMRRGWSFEQAVSLPVGTFLEPHLRGRHR